MFLLDLGCLFIEKRNKKGKALFKGIHEKLNLKLLKNKKFSCGNVIPYYQHKGGLTHERIRGFVPFATSQKESLCLPADRPAVWKNY